MSRESEDIDEECCICFDRPPTVLFLPCGHGVVCRACFDRMSDGLQHGLDRIVCPLCRRDVQDVLHLEAAQIREISRRAVSDELHADISDPIVELGLQRVRAGRQWLRANHSWPDDADETYSPEEIDAQHMRQQGQSERQREQRAQQEAERAQQAENAWLYDSNSEGFDDEWSDDSTSSSSVSRRPDWGTSRLDTGRWLPVARDDLHETYPARRRWQEGAAGAREGGRADMPRSAQLHCMLGQLQTCLYNNRRS